MTNKMTKRDWFAVLAAVVEDYNMENKEEAKAFIAHEIELLEKKSEKSALTKSQKENVGIMETISAVLADMGKPVTITEMMVDTRLSGYSNQKLSALLRKMGLEGKVVKTIEKKKSYFSLAN